MSHGSSFSFYSLLIYSIIEFDSLVDLVITVLESPTVLDGFQSKNAAKYGVYVVHISRVLLGGLTLLTKDYLNCIAITDKN